MQAYPNSYDFREKARKVLKPNLSTALMLAFLASLPGLLSSAVRTMYISPALSELYSLVMSIYSGETAHLDTFEKDCLSILQQALALNTVRFACILSVVVWLVTPFLNLGMQHGLLKLVRGEPVSTGDVFSRGRYFFKAIGLQMWIAVKEFLWMVPGIAVCMAGIPAALWLNSLSAYAALYFAGLALILVLGLRAALHYSQADLVMADDPTVKIGASVKESIRIMRRRKKYYIGLYVSFIGWILLSNIAVELFSGVSSLIGILA